MELALRAIHPSVIPDELSHHAVHLLGPLVLGPSGWALIDKPDTRLGSWYDESLSSHHAPNAKSGTKQACWKNFRCSVEKVFGLTSTQRKARFFQLQRRPTETSEDFVLRVEEARVRL